MEQSRTRSGSISESIAHGRDVVGNAAADAVDAAAPDLQALRNDLNHLKDTVAKFIAQASSDAAKSARTTAANAAGQVGSVARDLAGKGADLASAANEQGKSLVTEVETMARNNPFRAIVGAVVVGLVIGLMGRRR